jgi:hypothetical protein
MRTVAVRGFLLLVSLAAMLVHGPAAANEPAASNDLFDEPDPAAVINGGLVPACAWPAVGAFYEQTSGLNFQRCGAVYVGGRVIVTAAHCVQNDGYALEQACEDDDDCPDLSSEVGSMVTLTCEDHLLIPGRKHCRDDDPDHDDISNNPSYVRFGSAYEDLYGDEEVRKSVSIAYCRLANTEIEGTNPHADDFAYCLLTEEPGIQPVPLIMPCEVDAELGAGTDVVAVGFGQCILDSPTSGGYKRLASATTFSAITSVEDSYSVNVTWSTVGPTCEGGGGSDETGADADDGVGVHLAGGDSGGGLFAQMSDGTWRLIGINQTAFPAFTSVWPYIDWILEDPNISAADIRPCHDANGDWTGGAACVSSPSAPGTASGVWHTGRSSCDGTVVARTDLCGEEVKAGLEAAYGDPASAAPDGDPPRGPDESAGGCSSTPGRPSGVPFALGATFGLLMFLVRRTRGGAR